MAQKGAGKLGGTLGGFWGGTGTEFSAGKANFSLAVVKNVNISCGLMRTAVALVLVGLWSGILARILV